MNNTCIMAHSIILCQIILIWLYVDQKSAQVSGIPTGEPKKCRIQTIPMNRPGSPEEVAKLAVFLASDEASYIHGQIVNVNGGDFMS